MYLGVIFFSVSYLDVIQEWFNDQLDYNYDIEGNTGGLIFSLFMMVITALTIFLVNVYRKKTSAAVGLINIGVIAAAFWVLRILTRVAERPSYYFLPFSFAALVYAINCIDREDDKLVAKWAIIFLALALYLYRFLTNLSTLVPYSFWR